jgi:hypothetical protein
MPGQIQQVYINAVRFGFQDVSLEGETLQQYGSIPFQFPKGCVQGINWEAAQDSGEVQGNRIQPVGVTNGYGLTTGDLELLVSEGDDFQKTITGSGQFPFMSVFFNLRLTYAVNNGIDVRIVEINGVKVKNTGAGNAKGSDAATTRYQFRAGQVFVNGIAMYADPST